MIERGKSNESHLGARGVEAAVVEEHEEQSGEKGDVVRDDAGQAVPLRALGVLGGVEPGGDERGVFEEAEGVVEQILEP